MLCAYYSVVLLNCYTRVQRISTVRYDYISWHIIMCAIITIILHRTSKYWSIPPLYRRPLPLDRKQKQRRSVHIETVVGILLNRVDVSICLFVLDWTFCISRESSKQMYETNHFDSSFFFFSSCGLTLTFVGFSHFLLFIAASYAGAPATDKKFENRCGGTGCDSRLVQATCTYKRWSVLAYRYTRLFIILLLNARIIFIIHSPRGATAAVPGGRRATRFPSDSRTGSGRTFSRRALSFIGRASAALFGDSRCREPFLHSFSG